MGNIPKIFITGDTHGEIGRFYDEQLNELGQGDYLFVCGDFMFIYAPRGTADYNRQQRELDQIAALPYTVCFVDGNHENFDLLNEYPQEVWQGGRIHRIRRNVIHLMRGQVYEIGGRTVFTMGGAHSTDQWSRREGLSWWPAELPSNDEYHEASDNLKRVGGRVDIILTHTAPREVISLMGRNPYKGDLARKGAQLIGFLDWIMYDIQYKKWYFGHWHQDMDTAYNTRAVYFDIVQEV